MPSGAVAATAVPPGVLARRRLSDDRDVALGVGDRRPVGNLKDPARARPAADRHRPGPALGGIEQIARTRTRGEQRS